MIKLFFIFLILTTSTYAQKQSKSCGCVKDSLLNDLVTCEEKILKDKSTIYYQFDCDSIWLTLKNIKGQKKILYSLSGDDYIVFGPLNYRLGYYFVQEFNQELLFRWSCPATGACSYILVNKQSGKPTQEFNNLIFDLNKESNNDFLIYFEDQNTLAVQFVDLKERIQIQINSEHFTQIIPEFQFVEISVVNKTLVMTYDYDENGIDKTGKIEQNISRYIR